jgi:hypothetical protein
MGDTLAARFAREGPGLPTDFSPPRDDRFASHARMNLRGGCFGAVTSASPPHE